MYPHKLNVHSIYKTLLGESTEAGRPCIIIRLAGCSVGCHYCDTKYAINSNSGKENDVDDVVKIIEGMCSDCNLLLITGGEPLEQRVSIINFISKLNRRTDLDIMIETSGTYEFDANEFKSTIMIMDIKCPSSGIHHKNKLRNIYQLTLADEIKFVIQDRKDYDYMKKILNEYGDIIDAKVLISPVWGKLSPEILANWVLQDDFKVNIRLQLQLHKIIWGNERKDI